jgi:hypothetical protein
MTETTAIYNLDATMAQQGESLMGNQVDHAKSLVELLARAPGGCRWKLQAGGDHPTPEQSVVWEYFYPEGDGRGTTGYQVQWHAGASS